MTRTAAHPTSPATGTGFAAVIFDMNGVVTDTAGLHAAAWKTLFDTMLPRLADAEADHHAHIDGRTREDGVRAFLASRNLHVPDGSAAGPAC